ncbi:MAG: SusC/RagA family TonB-linked outer membrane protein [Prolixibacteraceae bacterium]
MKKIALLLAFFAIGLQVLVAQTKEISGTVTSADDGGSIPGVSVSLKGTTLGTITDMDGMYRLRVPQDAQSLVFTFVGMKIQEVAIGNQTTINVKMASENINVDEVVVTALGISREKKSLGYSVQEVKGDDINAVKGNDFTSALSGKIAGLQIKTNTNFGGSTNVVVRGSSSLTGNNQALFVIDGVPIDNTILNNTDQQSGLHGYDYGNTASDINPNDIETVSVLKGAAATALYGSRAANGVILITTKKGTRGKDIGVSYTGNITVGVLDKSTFPKYQKEYGAGYGLDWYGGDLSGHDGLESYDWNGDGTSEYIVPTYEDASMGERFDPSLNVYQWNSFVPGLSTYGKALPWVAAAHDPSYFFETATTVSHAFQVTGGSEKTTYRFSYQNLSQNGIMPNSNLDKNNFSFTGSYDLTDKIKVSSFANYIKTETKGRNNTGYSGNILSSFRQWYQTNVDVLDQKAAFEQLGTNATWNMNAPDDLSPAYWDNPYWERYKNYQTDSRDRFIGYTKVDWKATDFMTITARVAIDHYTYIQEERRAIGSITETIGLGDASSGYSVKRGDFSEMNFDLMATFKKDFSQNLNLTGLLGTNIRKRSFSSVLASTNGGLAVPDIYSLANTKSPLELPEETKGKIQVNGYFANASLGISNMLFLEGSLRVDQSSTLPTDNQTYLYPSASASFVFTKFINPDVLSLGKFRANYAEVGNDAPFASLYDVYYQAFPFKGNGVAYSSSTVNNSGLKSERTKSFETGVTLNFLDNRVGFDVAYYDNRTVDQIMPVAISYATGSSYKYVNSGEVSNKGIELMLNLTPVKTKDFRWDVDINWAKNKSKVISLAEGVDNLQLASLQGGVTINARVGEALGTIQGTDYVYYNGIRTPENRIIEDGIYQKTATSDQIIGNVNADWTAGLRNGFSYKNLNLSFLIDWKHGGDLFSLDMWYGSSTGLYEESAGLNDLGNPIRNYVTGDPATDGGLILQGVLPDGTKNTVRSNEMGTYYTPVGSAIAPNAMFIYDASYIKLRELSLTYTLPRTLFKGNYISGMSVSLVGSNLWIIHKNLPYADPETTQGAGNVQGWQSGVMPSTRNLGFTLNVNF